MRKKIAVALAAGVAFGTMFAVPFAVPVAVAAESSVTNKTSAAAYAEQGDKLFTEGKYVEAAEACEKAAELAQNNEEYWTSAGFCYFKAERWDKSAICYKNAIKINPNNGLAHFYCGIAYFHQVEVPHQLSTRTIYERAAKYGDRAAELLPDDVNVRMAAGRIQESLAMYVGSGREKHLDKAYKNYCKAVDLDPNNASNAATLSRFVPSWSRYGFQPYTPVTSPAPQSAGTTDVTGATGAPSGEISAGGLEYEVLDSGAVKLVLRRGSRKSELENYANEAEYWKANTYYIFTKPEEFKAWHGTYAVGNIYTYDDKNILQVGDFFDYDPMTKTVQFYGEDIGRGGNDPERAWYGSRIRVIGRNTVYAEEPGFPEGHPYVNKGPFKVGTGNHFGEKFPMQYTERYLPCEDSYYRDWNGGSWSFELVFKDGKREISYPHGLLNEIAILCCALNGNFGEMPELPNVQEFEHGSDYNFSF